jgi:hypothetical protein
MEGKNWHMQKKRALDMNLLKLIFKILSVQNASAYFCFLYQIFSEECM